MEASKNFEGGATVKRLRISWLTGEVNANGDPIMRRQTITVSDDANISDMQNAVSSLSTLTTYTLSDAYLITYEEV